MKIYRIRVMRKLGEFTDSLEKTNLLLDYVSKKLEETKKESDSKISRKYLKLLIRLEREKMACLCSKKMFVQAE